jgi:hypothetical protein
VVGENRDFLDELFDQSLIKLEALKCKH